jgi:Mn2+/Fe2+ NRAMP family transporter
VNFVLVPLIVVTHPSLSAMASHAVLPSIRGGISSSSVLLIISIIGTTVAPWQLFFQESNIVDKKISPRWLNYERADTVIGSIVVVIGAAALMAVAAVISTRSTVGNRWTTLVFARDLGRLVGHDAGTLFAVVLLNAAVLGAAVVTLASSYALGDLSNQPKGLDARFSEARGFYGAFGGLLGAAGLITLLPHAPLGIITLMVQAMCGMLLPSTTIFVMILANDREMLGPWVNARWLNLLAALIITALTVLSMVLMVSTLFPGVNVVTTMVVVGGVGGVGFLVGAPLWWRRSTPRPAYAGDRGDWRTPRLALATPPVTTPARRWLYRAQAGYLAVAGVLLIVRFIQIVAK